MNKKKLILIILLSIFLIPNVYAKSQTISKGKINCNNKKNQCNTCTYEFSPFTFKLYINSNGKGKITDVKYEITDVKIDNPDKIHVGKADFNKDFNVNDNSISCPWLMLKGDKEGNKITDLAHPEVYARYKDYYVVFNSDVTTKIKYKTIENFTGGKLNKSVDATLKDTEKKKKEIADESNTENDNSLLNPSNSNISVDSNNKSFNEGCEMNVCYETTKETVANSYLWGLIKIKKHEAWRKCYDENGERFKGNINFNSKATINIPNSNGIDYKKGETFKLELDNYDNIRDDDGNCNKSSFILCNDKKCTIEKATNNKIFFKKINIDDDAGCESILGESSILVNKALKLMQYLGPVLAIVFSTLDFIKVALSGKQEDMTKAGKKLGIRIFLSILLFFVLLIVQILLSFFGIILPIDCLESK